MKSSNNKKDKWEIPTDWEVRRIDTISTSTAGGTPSTKEKNYWGGNIRWMNSGELNQKKVYEVEGRITDIGLKNSSTKILPKNCVLIGLAGQGKTRGTVAINMIELSTNQSIAAILPSELHNPDYLYYNLDFRYEELRSLSAGDGGRGGLNLSIINSLKIPLPPLPEQNSIATCLSTWDRAIQTTDALIAQKEQCKKWLMQMLLTGKMRLKGFSGEWKVVRLIEVAEVDKYSLSSNTSPEYSFQYLSLSDVDSGVADIKSEIIMYKDSPSRARRIVQKGDILLATVRPNLQAFLIIRDDVKDFIASTGFAVITCTTIFNEFLYQYLYSSDFMRQIEALLTGSNYPAINSSDVKHLKILFPLLEEQTAIAQVLQTADKEITLLRAKADKLREQKKGLMQVLLTGRVRMKGVSGITKKLYNLNS